MNGMWQATIVAVAFMAFVAVMFLLTPLAYGQGGIDTALKVWAAFGTLLGVITGAIPSYFFHQQAQSAQKDANALRMAADDATIARARNYGLK